MLFCDFCLVFLVLSEMCTELYISDDRLVKYNMRQNLNAAYLSVSPSPRRANPKCPRTTSHRCRSAVYEHFGAVSLPIQGPLSSERCPPEDSQVEDPVS